MYVDKEKAFFKKLGKRFDLPPNVIQVICNSPFKFTLDVAKDPDDMKDIMFTYLCKIGLKPRFKRNGTKNTKELPPESRYTHVKLV